LAFWCMAGFQHHIWLFLVALNAPPLLCLLHPKMRAEFRRRSGTAKQKDAETEGC
jgi:hypothetical protein